jgi:hypothetical protein
MGCFSEGLPAGKKRYAGLRAGAVIVLAPALFTNSTEVIGVMGSMLPLMCLSLVIHTASMATEGMLLAGAAARA